MAPFSLVTAGVSLLAKSFSVLSSSSSLARCTSVLPASCAHFRCMSSQTSSPPKKPQNGFVRFFIKQRPIMVRENRDIKSVDVMRKIGEMWKMMNPEQKRPFVEAYLRDQKKFEVDMQTYKAQLTPAQIKKQAEEHKEKLHKQDSIRIKQESNRLGKPKGRRNQFAIYVSENFEEARGENTQQKMKSLSDDWHRLPEPQKQVYRQLAEDDRVRFRNEMKTWEEHMVEIGRGDLIYGLKYAKKMKKRGFGRNH